MLRTLRALLRSALHPVETTRQEVELAIRGNQPSTWRAVNGVLRQQKLTPLIGYALRRHGLLQCVPEQFRDAVSAAYRDTVFRNTLRLDSLARVITAFEGAGIAPIVFKGAVLAAEYYPDPGCRPMGDIDILIPGASTGDTAPPDRAGVAAVMAAAAFEPLPTTEEDPAVYYRNASNVIIDTHFRFRLFEEFPLEQLTRRCAAQDRSSEAHDRPALTWEPNAMLLHLSHHLLMHRGASGIVVGWLVDIGLVVDRHRAELEFDRICALSPSDHSLRFLLRALGFVRDELGIEPPPSMRAAIDGAEPLQLARIIRERRLRPWGLRRIHGWLRLAKALATGSFDHDQLSLPRAADFAMWPTDLLHESRAQQSGAR